MFIEDTLNKSKTMEYLTERAENIVEKGENAGNQHFLLFPHCFQLPSLPGLLTIWMYVKGSKPELRSPSIFLLVFLVTYCLKMIIWFSMHFLFMS